MRKELLFLLALAVGTRSSAQLNVEPHGVLYLEGSARLVVQGDIDSKADILGSGTVLFNGNTLQHLDMHGFMIPCFQLDNAGDACLESDVRIGSSFVFSKGKMSLNSSLFLLDEGAAISGYDREHYFISNAAGLLVKRSLGALPFIFPVGSDREHYHPLTLTQNGDIHDIGVRTMPYVLSHGGNGMPLEKEVVNASWEVKDISPGTDNLSLTAGWGLGEELPGFNRTGAGLSYYEENKGWDKPPTVGAAGGNRGYGGNGGYVLARTHLVNTGFFSIGAGIMTGAADFSVFPNPASTGFYVTIFHLPDEVSGGRYLLNLLDLRGQLRASRETADGTYYFDLGKGGLFSAGEYLLQVRHNGNLLGTKKIILIRQ